MHESVPAALQHGRCPENTFLNTQCPKNHSQDGSNDSFGNAGALPKPEYLPNRFENVRIEMPLKIFSVSAWSANPLNTAESPVDKSLLKFDTPAGVKLKITIPALALYSCSQCYQH
jgi:hypothetical protein